MTDSTHIGPVRVETHKRVFYLPLRVWRRHVQTLGTGTRCTCFVRRGSLRWVGGWAERGVRIATCHMCDDLCECVVHIVFIYGACAYICHSRIFMYKEYIRKPSSSQHKRDMIAVCTRAFNWSPYARCFKTVALQWLYEMCKKKIFL